MKILLVNKYLYPKGGAETYVFQLGRLLAGQGHEVQYFGLAHRDNLVGNRAGAYAAFQDFESGIRNNLTAPLRILYSAEARRKLRQVLEDFQPDVVHVNNIHFHLTPSILLETEAYRKATKPSLKLVYTAHDYQLICPSHGLFDRNIQPCEKCLGGNYTHCLRSRCVKNSYAKSLLGMLDAYLWKISPAYSYINTILCCSDFLKGKLDTQPRFSGKTLTLHNFMEEKPFSAGEAGSYVLEFGHLSRDKGTDTLLEAARRMPETEFLFAGWGEAADSIRAVPNARYVGFQRGEALDALIRGAAVTVYPSRWYENCPFSVMESLMLGTPVVASRIGGIPELVEEGRTGDLFRAGDVSDLEAVLRSLLGDHERLARYRKNCNALNFETPESYYQKLMRIYGA